MTTTAVIPVHNRADLLERLLFSARAQTVPFAEILVIDNGSTDNAPALATSLGCRVISMGGNAGFARAVNAGWKAAAQGCIAILNSDVELDPHWLERLLCHIGDASFATGTIFDAASREVIDGTYDLVSLAGCAWRAGHGQTAIAHNACVAAAVVPATACIFRRGVLEALGGFDEGYGSYLEDVDLGLRCVRAGFFGVYVPSAIAWHHGSATFGRWDARVVRLTSRNQLLLISRHYDRALLRACWWQILAGQLLWGLVALRHGAAIPWLAGKRDGLRGFRLAGAPSVPLRNFLIASEIEIRERAIDPYWRWYFRLTSAARMRHNDT